VLADTSVDSLRRVVAQAQLMATPATLYAATLASLKLRHFDHAYAALQRLQSALAGNAAGGRQGQLLAIELALAAGQPQEAAALFLTQAAPLDRPTLFLQAQTALALRQVPSAQPLDIKTAGARIADTPALTVSAVLQSMQLWVHTHPQDASGWQWLGRLATAQGLPLLALRAEAEMQLANLDWVAALDRLKAAQDYAYRAGLGKQAGDHIDASIIDTRLREVQAQVRQMSREKTL
jgi:predicted Zn-dependent protease